MNLENYFSKYLCKGSARQQGRQEAEVERGELAAAPPFQIVYPPLKNSDDEADKSNTSSSGGTEPRRSDGPDAGTAGPRPAVNPTVARPGTFTVLTDDGAELEDLLALGIASTVSKRSRDTVASGLVTPVTERRRLRVHVESSDSDDDDDGLDVLLGKDTAQSVRQAEAAEKHQRHRQKQQHHQMAIESDSDGDGRDYTAAAAVSSLNWGTRSSAAVEGYGKLFERQFAYELRSDAALLDSFEPFFRDSRLDRITAYGDLNCVFLPPPRPVTAECIGALPGCVLRDYQVAGVQFLLSNFHRGMSCILADDMGLGKTAQVSAFLSALQQLDRIDGPHLIVSPLSTLTCWTRELAQWAPRLTVLKYHGVRKAREQARRGHHYRHAVVVTTPAVLLQDKGFFRRRAWVTVTVDEAHVLKGHASNVTHICKKLQACFRIAVTGTPVHNRAGEVWSLVGFLYPSLTAAYGGRAGGEEALAAAQDCARLLGHVMLRRTKETMELGIPPRTDELVTMLEPTHLQSQLLHLMAESVLQQNDEDREANGGGGGGRRLQAHLSHQRAVCNHPMTLRLLAAEARAPANATLSERLRLAGIAADARTLVAPSAKMVHLDGMLARLKAEGHRCLLFSNFTSTLDLIEVYCGLRGYSYERLDGNCNRVERELSMLRFNAPNSDCFLFLVTTTAGGVGVTLTGADTVILFDAHFNPQLDRQAADRAHRIGQTRPVHVYRLCLRNTVEEHIRQIADRKASLGDFIVEGGVRQKRAVGGPTTTNGSGSGNDNGGDGDGARLTADDLREVLLRLGERRRSAEASAASPTTADVAAQAEGYPMSLSQRAEEDRAAEELARIERERLPGYARGGATAATRGGGGSGFGAISRTNNCLVCGDIMRPLEPLYHCQVCPKAYHADCLGLRRPKPGEPVPRHWTCPRHSCGACGKGQQADGAIFMCGSCPRSFCFDCLDPRYLVLDETGTRLLHVRRTYPEMEAEGMEERRSAYYITCLKCSGVVATSEDDDDDEESEDGSGEDSDGSIAVISSGDSDG